MNISSENIVDVFLRKISESLPVGERDAYQEWKRDQEYAAAHAADRRYDTVIERKRAKKTAEVADWLTKFFRFNDTDNKHSLIPDEYKIFIDNDTPGRKIVEIRLDGRVVLLERFFDLMASYGVNCRYDSDSDSFKISLIGKREVVGPLYGKLKKLGFNPNRHADKYMGSGGYNENQLTFEFQPDDFIEDIKKGLRITDFADTQPE